MRIITIQGNDHEKLHAWLIKDEAKAGDVSGVVKDIIEAVKLRGDEALLEYTNKFDRNNLSIVQLKISEDEIDKAWVSCEPELISALQLAAARIKSYYEKLKPEDLRYTDETGVTLGARYMPLDSVGIYVPGGKANYPSSVLMNAIPAKVAGVEKIIMACPSPQGEMNPVVLAAAKIAGVDEIYRIGGAQAVAALSFGTGIVPKVDKIVGPGNAYVAEAKRQVFGIVGIDMIAGPSEILIIADENNNPDWLAADLLSQAEHDESARSILVTTSQNLATKVITSVYEMLHHLGRKDIATASIENNGIVIVVESLEKAAEISNLIAPEHLELAVDNPEELLRSINNAGAIFMGRHTPEAIGDYIAGPSHVLPTGSSTRFSSGLSVTDFMKRQSIISCSEASFKVLSDATVTLANSEGLAAHALSVLIRKK